MQPGLVLRFPLFNRENFSSEVCELHQFLLDRLQPLVPLAVSDLSLCFVSTFTSIPMVQFLKVCDLAAEICNLFAKHC